jgi:hypothetical protein
MERSFLVEPVVTEEYVGFTLFAFDGDELVYDQFFRTTEDAEEVGEDWVAYGLTFGDVE